MLNPSKVTGFSYYINDSMLESLFINNDQSTITDVDIYNCLNTTLLGNDVPDMIILKRGTHFTVNESGLIILSEMASRQVDDTLASYTNDKENRIMCKVIPNNARHLLIDNFWKEKLLVKWTVLSNNPQLIINYAGGSRLIKYRINKTFKSINYEYQL